MKITGSLFFYTCISFDVYNSCLFHDFFFLGTHYLKYFSVFLDPVNQKQCKKNSLFTIDSIPTVCPSNKNKENKCDKTPPLSPLTQCHKWRYSDVTFIHTYITFQCYLAPSWMCSSFSGSLRRKQNVHCA